MCSGSFIAVVCLTGLTLLAGCATNTRAPVVDLSVGGGTPVSPAVQQPPVQPAVLSKTPAQAALPPSTPTPTPTPTPPGPVQPVRSATYVVKPGDTLYSIARAAGSSVDELARRNQLSDPTQLHVGQVLALTGTPPPVKPVAPVVPTPPQVKPNPVAPTPASQWAWPASGDIIQSFSAATKGIDIAGVPGAPVRAAADGKVAYSGNGVRGLGNLIILNHADGFISAYAHNRTLLVKAGQVVKRGTQIAEIGQTDTSSPRLHFEMRRQGTPVNPLQYLPKR